MGLDVSHGCWSGGYKSFNRWRAAIAQQIGIPLELMEGFMRHWINDSELAELEALIVQPPFTEARAAGIYILRSLVGMQGIPWTVLGSDPLVHLLDHSDCNSEIAVEHLFPLADRLAELIPGLEQMGNGGGHIGNYADATRKFIAGLRLAANRGEPVRFG